MVPGEEWVVEGVLWVAAKVRPVSPVLAPLRVLPVERGRILPLDRLYSPTSPTLPTQPHGIPPTLPPLQSLPLSLHLLLLDSLPAKGANLSREATNPVRWIQSHGVIFSASRPATCNVDTHPSSARSSLTADLPPQNPFDSVPLSFPFSSILALRTETYPSSSSGADLSSLFNAPCIELDVCEKGGAELTVGFVFLDALLVSYVHFFVSVRAGLMMRSREAQEFVELVEKGRKTERRCA